MMNSQRSDVEKIILIKGVKKKGYNEVIKRNEIINNILKQQIMRIFSFDVYAKLYLKMNEIIHEFLFAGDKFMPEMHLGQTGFTYSACGPFTKNKERIRKFKETGDTSYIYKNELDKACFLHDMAQGDFKDLARRTASDKVLRDKAFNIAKNPKYDEYQRGLLLWFTNFLIKSRK